MQLIKESIRWISNVLKPINQSNLQWDESLCKRLVVAVFLVIFSHFRDHQLNKATCIWSIPSWYTQTVQITFNLTVLGHNLRWEFNPRVDILKADVSLLHQMASLNSFCQWNAADLATSMLMMSQATCCCTTTCNRQKKQKNVSYSYKLIITPAGLLHRENKVERLNAMLVNSSNICYLLCYYRI